MRAELRLGRDEILSLDCGADGGFAIRALVGTRDDESAEVAMWGCVLSLILSQVATTIATERPDEVKRLKQRIMEAWIQAEDNVIAAQTKVFDAEKT